MKKWKLVLLSNVTIVTSGTIIIPWASSCKKINSVELWGMKINNLWDLANGGNGILLSKSVTNLSGEFSKSVTDNDMLQSITTAMNVYSYAYAFCICMASATWQVWNEIPQIVFSNVCFKTEVVNGKLTSNTHLNFDLIYKDEIGRFTFAVNGNQSLCAAGEGFGEIGDNALVFGQYGEEYVGAHNFHLSLVGLGDYDFDTYVSSLECFMNTTRGDLFQIMFPKVTTWPSK